MLPCSICLELRSVSGILLKFKVSALRLRLILAVTSKEYRSVAIGLRGTALPLMFSLLAHLPHVTTRFFFIRNRFIRNLHVEGRNI